MISYVKKIFDILTLSQKINYIFLLFFFLISALIEMIGISFVFIFLTQIISGKLLLNLPFLNFFFLHISKFETKLILTLLIFIYFFKSFFMSFFHYFLGKFGNDLELYVGTKLHSVYMLNTIDFHLKTNSSELIRNIIIEAGNFSYGIIVNSLLFLKNFILLTLIFFYLLNLSFNITAIVFLILFIFTYLYQKILSSKNYEWGTKRQIKAALRLKSLQESFNGIKTIKIYEKENLFLKKYKEDTEAINLIRLNQSIFSNLPKIWLEFFCIFGVSIFFIISINLNKNLYDYLPIIALLGIILIRSIPAFNELLFNIQSIQYSKSSLIKVTQDFKNLKSVKKNHINFNNRIKFNNIYFTYTGSTKIILKNINFEIKKNQSIGIYGESGVGKSTLLNIIFGLLQPTSGSIIIDEKIYNNSDNSLNNLFAYLPQDIFLMDGSIKENITFFEDDNAIDTNKLNYIIEQCQLKNLISTLKQKENSQIGELGDNISGGEKQKIAIARALYRNAQIFVFDEVTKSLDLQNQRKINSLIKSFFHAKTIINVSHDVQSLEEYDVIFKLNNGLLHKIK
jgi:ABC-type multidrug transport system fused ATPase/permease subunit